MHGSRRQQATDGNLPVGHIDVKLVASPELEVAGAVLLGSDIAGNRQILHHFFQRHSGLLLKACGLWRLFLSLFWATALALGRRHPPFFAAWFFTRLNRRGVPAEVTDETVVLGFLDQRLMNALGQFCCRKAGKGA